MTTSLKEKTNKEPALYGIKSSLEKVFPDSLERPSLRAWNEWRAKGYYSYVKINKRVFINPAQARRELTKRFTISAIGE